MSDDEFDITKSLALNGDSDSEYDSSDSDNEVQDIISDNEEEKIEQPKKKQKLDTSFPSLELDDDKDAKNEDQTIASYFTTNNPNAKKAKAGTFASFGFSKVILSNIHKKGFKQPTPIQRKTIPLILDNIDVVGMARTGSGKTAAFTLPMIEKLRAHQAKSGVRSIILSPSRELALQTYKQVKEFSNKTDLRVVLVVGGDSLDDQFASMMGNPDIVIATPGRFMHLKIEMDLNLSSVEYIVFDEADRLFELGFAEQLNELIASLPTSRQTLLFSATLPKSLVEFAKAGLSNPTLVRLDAESKVSDQLEMAFITTKRTEREANLLYLLQEVIKMPLPDDEQLKKYNALTNRQFSDDESDDEEADNKKKRKFKKERLPPANVLPSKYSTIVFVPTKHHVEYISVLLKDYGYLISYIYGTLDQTARKQQLYQFRSGLTSILVVTDVAARGIDIPILANVINFTLPSSSKIFIHRVGRTARAGNKGWAYSIVNEKELPYLLDLELFLGKKLLTTSIYEHQCEYLKKQGKEELPVSYTKRLVIGSSPRNELEPYQEIYEGLMKNNYDLRTNRDVAAKGEKLFYRTRQPASAESVKRSKELIETGNWDEQHVLFGANEEKEKQKFLDKLHNRYSKETVFEFNSRGKDRDEDSFVEFMHKRRRQLAPIQRKAKERKQLIEMEKLAGLSHSLENELFNNDDTPDVAEEDLKHFEDGDKVLTTKSYKDPNFYMSHYAPSSDIQDKQLAINSSFANNAANAAFDLDNDDKMQVNSQVYKWDSKKGNYVNSRSTDKKYIISESGQRIPATFKSGRFDEWKKSNPNVNNAEFNGGSPSMINGKFKHKQSKAPRLPDKFRDDFHKQKKRVETAIESGKRVKGYNKPGQQQELKSTEQIRKQRKLKEKRRAKNGRPAKRY
ncbi:ATP-dependent RNA helicase Dbp10p [[Candida] jaroonii]|uniref:ATP-dependent RNA helicase Dbp10p n=1 Tax=[Candida] jaroonii TaxID=467808 RepID=A0ACA9Y5I0_9ASCO|nr:ATP-dependent RNA helicase Dbp10p [[Candida] jaroonii]